MFHANISSAIKTDDFVSLFSLNVTSKGHTYVAMPSRNNDYITALYKERHVPITFTSLKKCFSEEIMSKFLKYNETIQGKSIIGIYTNPSVDNSVELFHQFAKRWTFGTGDKSTKNLANICDVNSHVAEQLNRPDLKATWQVFKMIYGAFDGLQSFRMRSSENTQSRKKNNQNSDSINAGRYFHHHHHHLFNAFQTEGGKGKNMDAQQQENEINDDLNGKKQGKSQEQIIPPNSQMGKEISLQFNVEILSIYFFCIQI